MKVLSRVLLAAVVVVLTSAPALASRFIVAGADAGGGPHVVIRFDADNNGTFETISDSFYAFVPASPGAPLFTGGVRVATGDFDGDGNDELITAQGPGGNLVRVWSLTPGGKVSALREEFAPFGAFAGGIFVAAGDFDNDGRAELVTAADAGGGPFVIIWRDGNRDGRVSDEPPLAAFFAYTPGFSGGVRVAAGNVNNAGGSELITAPGPGGGPDIRVFTWNGSAFTLADEFFAYNPAFTGGVYVAAGAIENAGNGGAEIITAPGPGGGPDIRIFTDSNNNGRVSDDPLFDEFFAYTPGFTGGVRVAAGDTDGSGFFVEVVTVPGPGGGPHVRLFDDNGDPGARLSDNPTSDEFFAFDPAWGGGAFLAVGVANSAAFALNSLPIIIPDVSTVNAVICVPPGMGVIKKLEVGLGISHSFDGDLDVTMTNLSTGASLVLFHDVGGTNEGFIITLSDTAGTEIGGASNPKVDGPIVGTFKPQTPGALSIFNGQPASGCWMLTITDDSGGDTGMLFDWVLYFKF